jgi:hypothetical protein
LSSRAILSVFVPDLDVQHPSIAQGSDQCLDCLFDCLLPLGDGVTTRLASRVSGKAFRCFSV